MVYAFPIAGTQASGLREVFGSMCKPFHAGKAAQNGTMSALLTQRGFTGTDGIFEGARGLVGVMASGHDIGEATKDLGKHWELPQNGLKPFAAARPIMALSTPPSRCASGRASQRKPSNISNAASNFRSGVGAAPSSAQ